MKIVIINIFSILGSGEPKYASLIFKNNILNGVLADMERFGSGYGFICDRN